MQTSADHWSRRRHVSHMTDEEGETWSPSGMSKVRSKPKSLVADCSMHALQTCCVCIIFVRGQALENQCWKREDIWKNTIVFSHL